MSQHHTKNPTTAVPPELPPPASVPDNSATIALLEEWERDDATDAPAAIAQAERDLAEFKAALNANRPPDKPVFP